MNKGRCFFRIFLQWRFFLIVFSEFFSGIGCSNIIIRGFFSGIGCNNIIIRGFFPELVVVIRGGVS